MLHQVRTYPLGYTHPRPAMPGGTLNLLALLLLPVGL